MRTEDHIPSEVLLDYVEGRADAETAARVSAHLEAGCLRCARHHHFWTRVLSALRWATAPTPPEDVVARAIAQGARKPEGADRPESPWSPWQQIVARLTFDSRLQPAAGVRETAAASFQLLFEAEGTGIDLLCECEEGIWRILGQAISPDALEPRWDVRAAGEQQVTVEADAHGEFCLAGLASGVYQLLLRGGGREILLPDVRLEEMPGDG
jgi:hypothetical protein